LQSLHDIELRPGLVGWLRSNEIRNDPATTEQLSALAEANRRLRESVEESQRQLAEALTRQASADDLAPLESTVSLTLEAKSRTARYPADKYREDKTVQPRWRELFAAIAIKLLAPTNDDTLNREIAQEIGYDSNKEISARVKERDWETVKAQFLSLEYVSITYGTTVMNTGALFWNLTELGKKVGLLLRSVRNTR
jgi:hypothetical protein